MMACAAAARNASARVAAVSGPVVVVGAHAQGLVLQVDAVPREGESVMGWGFDEPLDGGKSSNQAVAAARLGAPTVLVTVLGSDERGRRALAFFRGQGIDTRFCFEVDGPTDVGFVVLPPSKIPAIATALERNRELDARAIGRAAEAIRGGAVVVCALEAPQEAAVAAFRIARTAGVRTVLNPAPAAELDPELLALTDVLVPNEHEAAALAGAEGEPSELAAELRRRLAVPAVVVTAGAAGAYVAAEGAPAHVQAEAVEPVDTTGAGDAFVGALAVRLRAGDELTSAAAFAVRAATISVTRPGTMLAFAAADEV
jgi:ribokinase